MYSGYDYLMQNLEYAVLAGFYTKLTWERSGPVV